MSSMDVDSHSHSHSHPHSVTFAIGNDSRVMHDDPHHQPQSQSQSQSARHAHSHPHPHPHPQHPPEDGRNRTASIEERPTLSRARSNWVMSNPTDDIHAHYILGDQLGQPGQFGYARLCVHKQTGEQRAVKILSKGKFSRASDRKVHFDELRTEIEVMRRMRCDQIIRMYDVYETLSELYIVMELCRGGELFDRIKAQPDGSYSENDAVDIVRQMAMGIQYLHQHKIAHCDLKPDNFLFLDESKQSKLKIIDFGMSKWVKRRRYFHSLRGTPYYIAPEVITGRYSYHCDMWSMGVVMFVMLFGYPPFHGDSDQAIFAAVSRGFQPFTKRGFGAHFPADIPCSDLAKDLIAKLLTLDIAKRLTADEALEHPWFSRSSTVPASPMVTSVLTNLKAFTSTCKFKTGILNLMTTTLSEEELAQLKATFQEIDENGDGQITLNELSKAVERAGESTHLDDLVRLFKIADFDGSGTLSYNELVMTVVQRKLGAKEERLWNAFCKIDLNGDGKLTAEEIQQVLGKDSEEARRMIQEIDVDGDGEIDFDEFITMWMDKDNKSGSGNSSPSNSRSNSLAGDLSHHDMGPPDSSASPSKQLQKQQQQQLQQQQHAQALAQARAVALGMPANSAIAQSPSGASTPINLPTFHPSPSSSLASTSTSASASPSTSTQQPKHLSESAFANAAAVFGLTTKQASYKAPSGQH